MRFMNNKINKEQNLEAELNNDQLWEKAASDEPVLRADINLSASNAHTGLQRLDEGFNFLQFSDQSETNYSGSDK